MATGAPHLLHLATTTASTVNFQIPSIAIKLDRENYSLWRTTIIAALETFDLDDFVLNPKPPSETIVVPATDGTPATATAPAVPATPATTAPNPEFSIWKKRDRFVLLWLQSTLSERALAIVTRCHSSQMAWQAIEKTFQAQTRACRMQLKAQLQSLTKGSMTMIEYIERKRAIADSLAENLHPVHDEDLISYILTGLDSSYGAFLTAFMMKTDTFSIDDLAGLLLQEEARIEQDHLRQSNVQATPTALAVNRSNNNNNKSYLQGQNSNTSSGSRDSRLSDPKKRRPVCQLCQKLGHEAIDCWQRGNQTDYPSRRQNPRNPPRQANVAQYHSPSTVIDPAWYIDTGATDHVSPDIQKLNIAEDYKGDDKLQVGNGNQLSISHVGSSYLPHLKLPNVLIVPKLTKNLLSVSKLTADNDVYVEFWRNHCNVKSFQGHTILRGDVNDGLYRLHPTQNKVAFTGVRTSLHGWHQRLAHPHEPVLRRLVSQFIGKF
ncbi:hypothetical protein LXL04_027209 [Taraxacum kok-saghyz]